MEVGQASRLSSDLLTPDEIKQAAERLEEADEVFNVTALRVAAGASGSEELHDARQSTGSLMTGKRPVLL